MIIMRRASSRCLWSCSWTRSATSRVRSRRPVRCLQLMRLASIRRGRSDRFDGNAPRRHHARAAPAEGQHAAARGWWFGPPVTQSSEYVHGRVQDLLDRDHEGLRCRLGVFSDLELAGVFMITRAPTRLVIRDAVVPTQACRSGASPSRRYCCMRASRPSRPCFYSPTRRSSSRPCSRTSTTC